MDRTHLDRVFVEALGSPSFVFIDFDHTLFGGNSTEMFIASSRPKAVVRALDLLVRRCIPWRLSGLHKWFRLRDYVFCRLLIGLLPRNLERWQALGPDVFRDRINWKLDAALAATTLTDTAILTFGMEEIVRPMVRGTRWEGVALLATPSKTALSYFAEGKLDMARRTFGGRALETSMLVTDSEDDMDLLMAVGRPVLIHPYNGSDDEAH